jgi:hypothetical protein
MSIARAFTMRAKRTEPPSPPPIPFRSGTVKNLTGKDVTGSMISSPTFISTTNTLALNAPDVTEIRALRKKGSSISSSSSRSSGDESDKSSTGSRSRDTQFTDASSIENSPTASPGQSPDSYFLSKSGLSKHIPRRSASSIDMRTKSRSPNIRPLSPEIPHRAPSHSKKAHEVMARKRSLQQFSSHSPASSASSKEFRVSIDMFSPNVDSPLHPFGKELEQLDEIAEEFGSAVKNIENDADVKIMMKRNLAKFCANDYIMELAPLYEHCFGRPMEIAVDNGGGWI